MKKLYLSAGVIVGLIIGAGLMLDAATRSSTWPPFNTTTDINKLAVIGTSGYPGFTDSPQVLTLTGPSGATNLNVVVPTGATFHLKDPGATGELTYSAGSSFSLTGVGMSFFGGASIQGGSFAFTQASGSNLVKSTNSAARSLVFQPIGAATDLAVINTSTNSFSIRGTNTNDSATAGFVGETMTLSLPFASRVALSASLTSCNLGAATCPSTGGTQSITLTPGDWICTAQVQFPTGSTGGTLTNVIAAITPTTVVNLGTVDVVPSGGQVKADFTIPSGAIGSNQGPSVTIPPIHINVASNTPYFVVARSTFTVGAVFIAGFMQCTRDR